MKVLLVNKFFYLNGGSERVFFQERDFLVGQGYNVIDFSMKDERNFYSPFSEFFVPNVNYHNYEGVLKKLRQGISFVHSSIAVRNIEKLILQEKPSIAHLHNIYHQLTPSIIPVLKKYNIKVVLTLHDSKLVCPAYLSLRNDKICKECAGKFFWKPFILNCQGSRLGCMLLSIEAFWHKWRRSYDALDLLISPSQFLADFTSKRVANNKIQILHNGIDLDEYKPRYSDKGYGIYFGRLSKEKGIETLLDAHDKVKQLIPLKVVGTGPIKERLRNSYPDAEFLGYKAGRELKELVANSAFVIVPSEWYENCSMVVLESMALGKPIIGSRVGGIPEQIEDSKTGFLFEMGNSEELAKKIELLTKKPDLRILMGRAARKKLENEYSLRAHCSELLAIYDGLYSKIIP